MSTFTSRFGFNKFGGLVGGSIQDDGYKFANIDIDAVDKLFTAFEAHTHETHGPLANPSGPPTGAVVDTGGSFAPGLQLYYCVTYLDQNGLETGRSATLNLSTPDIAAGPALPAVTGGTGGNLVLGNYTYWLTQVTAGVESDISASASITLQAGQSSVTVTASESGTYNVYRQGPADVAGYKVHQIVAGTVFNDTGAVYPSDINYDPTQALPTSGVSLPGTYSTTIDIASADASLVGTLPGWKLYRSIGDDTFTSPALVATVTQTVSGGGGGIVTTYTDVGAATLTGQPPYASQTIASFGVVGGGGGGGGGAAGGYVENPILLASDGTPYRVDVNSAGSLIAISPGDTTYGIFGTPYPIGSGPCFDTSTDVWRLTVEEGGTLVTTNGATVDATRDQVYTAGTGPRLVTPTGSYDLTLDTSGALLLTTV
jgi:hypothetical protein